MVAPAIFLFMGRKTLSEEVQMCHWTATLWLNLKVNGRNIRADVEAADKFAVRIASLHNGNPI